METKRKYDPICSVDDCDKKQRTLGLCSMHEARMRRRGHTDKVERTRKEYWPSKNEAGYIILWFSDGRRIAQHRYMMEQHLGRNLLPGENVHHINGVRDDNRLENLELWNTRQPSGQRVEDKVAWAIEILNLYAKDKLK